MEVLHENTTLRSLGLAGSLLTAEDAADLASAIVDNYTLTTLDITGHRLNESSMRVLIDALKRNINIRTLRVDPQFLMRLQRARKMQEATTRLAKGDSMLTSLNLDGCIESEAQVCWTPYMIIVNLAFIYSSLIN